MFTVKTTREATQILKENLILAPGAEEVSLSESLGRILAEPVISGEYVPDFSRSQVDGYAVRASDAFGCSESLPAMLTLAGEIRMGEAADFEVRSGECLYIPTGGALPKGADAVVMLEYTDAYGDGEIGILKPCAPGENVIFRGDDLQPGKTVFPEGTLLRTKEIGVLSSLGISRVKVRRKIDVAILSTGDELIPAAETPKPGQIRDINSSLLSALVQEAGARPHFCGIVPDRKEDLQSALQRAVHTCDLVLISGGSSVGTRDLTCRILEEAGRILFHGIAMKPGKPTIFGLAKREGPGDTEIPVFGLPGHPGAAFFVTETLILPILREMAAIPPRAQIQAVLRENLSANHGRTQYTAVLVTKEEETVYARPVYMKSGMIAGIARADGYICVPRDTEGLPAGAEVTVTLF